MDSNQMTAEEVTSRLRQLEEAFGLSTADFLKMTAAGQDLSAYSYEGENLGSSPHSSEWLVLSAAQEEEDKFKAVLDIQIQEILNA